MPTGYTADITEGKEVSFERFVWGCTRAMGVTVMMREDPLDRLPPERFEPDTGYHEQNITRANAELKRIEAMSAEEVLAAANQEYEQALDDVRESNARSFAVNQRYQMLIDQVEAWTPPTKDHAGLREFMLQQLRDSQKWDCGKIDEPTPRLDWREYSIAALRRDIAYHEEEMRKEIERTESRNKWLAELRSSVPMPKR